MEKLLNFIIQHNDRIIEVLIFVILLLVVIIAFKFFMSSPEEAHAGGALDLSSLEESIKKLLEKAGQVQPAAGGNSAEADKLMQEISTLKAELENSKTLIETLQTTPIKSEAMSSGDMSKLEGKVKELEGKLAEYEIISEDIADLSFYKEENQKLQKEIEGLKANPVAAAAAAAPQVAAAPPAPAAPVAAVPLAAAAPPPPAPEPVAPVEIAAEPIVEAVPVAVPEVPPATDAGSAGLDDDLMAEFAAAVEAQKSGTLAQTEPASKVESPTEAELKPAAEESVDADLGQIDMDRMLAEASGIPVPEQHVTAEEAIGTGLDENKILQEAAAIGDGVSSEDNKLMGEFENFVKKST